jgi:tetratricopeptide (TPR) repeat protein
MLTSEGVIKLIDFGIAQKSNELVKQAYTPKYASPEQHKGGVLNESSDIYSLSMVLCHLLTGKLPILNENLDAYAFVPKLDADHYMSGLVTIIKKGLEISPRKRYQNSRALVKDFNRIHKLTKDYKRYVWRRDLAVGFTILLMVSGSILIYGGKEQLAYEAEVEYSALCQEANDLIYSNQDYDQAKLVLEEAQRIFEDRLSTYAIEAELLLHQKDYEAVLIHMNQLNTAFDLSRQDRLYYIWGTAYFELEDYENASFYIGLAYESAPYEEVYLRDYGVSSARNNDYVTSEKMITALKEGSYASDISFYVTAEYFMATNQYEEALDDFRRALDSSQDMEIIERCYLSMAKLYKSQQSILDPYAEKRVQVLEEAKEVLNRKDHRILMEQLGEAYFDYGRLSDDEDVKNQALNNALNTFNTLIELGNHQIHIYQNKLIIHQLLKDYQEVEKTIGEMLNLFPNQVSVQYQLVWHHLIVENDKEINERDYSKVLKAFNGIHNYSDVDYKQSDYIQLKGFMEELIINRWVDAADVKWN